MRKELEDKTKEELLDLGKELDVTGRHDMRKDELVDAILEMMDASTGVPMNLKWDLPHVYEGAKVKMNHLKVSLEVIDIQEGNPYIVVMETSRGGKHRLVVPRNAETRLERWRAGDEEWMLNADDAEYFYVIQEYKAGFEGHAGCSIPYTAAEDREEAARMAEMRMDGGDGSVVAEEVDIQENDHDNCWDVTASAFFNFEFESTTLEDAKEVAEEKLEDAETGDFHSFELSFVRNVETGDEL